MSDVNHASNPGPVEPLLYPTSNLGNFLEGLIVKGDYAMLWNQYIKFLIRVQDSVQQINQGILRAYGLPTREDLSKINSQIFELNNRLDELENRLSERNETATQS